MSVERKRKNSLKLSWVAEHHNLHRMPLLPVPNRVERKAALVHVVNVNEKFAFVLREHPFDQPIQDHPHNKNIRLKSRLVQFNQRCPVMPSKRQELLNMVRLSYHSFRLSLTGILNKFSTHSICHLQIL